MIGGTNAGGSGGAKITVDGMKANVKKLDLIPKFVMAKKLPTNRWQFMQSFDMDVYNNELYYTESNTANLYKINYSTNVETLILNGFGHYLCWHNNKLYCGSPTKAYDPSTGVVSAIGSDSGSLVEIDNELYLFINSNNRIKKLVGNSFIDTGIVAPFSGRKLFTRLHTKLNAYIYNINFGIYEFNKETFTLKTKPIPPISYPDYNIPTYTDFYNIFFGFSSEDSGTAEKFKAYIYDENNLTWKFLGLADADRSNGGTIIRNGDAIGLIRGEVMSYLTPGVAYPYIYI